MSSSALYITAIVAFFHSSGNCSSLRETLQRSQVVPRNIEVAPVESRLGRQVWACLRALIRCCLFLRCKELRISQPLGSFRDSDVDMGLILLEENICKHL